MPIPSEYQWITKINDLYLFSENLQSLINYFDDNYDFGFYSSNTHQYYPLTCNYDYHNMSVTCVSGLANFHNNQISGSAFRFQNSFSKDIITIRLVNIGDGRYNATYENVNLDTIGNIFSGLVASEQNYKGSGTFYFNSQGVNCKFISGYNAFDDGYFYWGETPFNSLTTALETIYDRFANITLYVDGELWVKGGTPTYTWASVPSISGKNGFLNLSQIASASINDGEAVSGASASAFDSLESSSRIDALVNVAELDNGKARATYTIPPLISGSYSYAKLTYKRGHIPTNKDDGTSVDLDTTDLGTTKTIDVSGIITGSAYWFVIFTDKSESEPKQLGANTEGLFFQIDLSTDGKDIVRYDASKTINNHKQGELYNNAGNPGYTISDGVLDVTSVGNQRDIEWAYDTSENPQTIPQNCTLTFEYDCYFPNGEGYLDWYVYDSNIMEVIYWCFDTKFSFEANKWYNCKTVCKLVDGKITRCKYVVDGVEVSGGSITPIDMPCTDKEGSKGISYIDFNLTQRTKFKNMSIYYDFSEYTDHGGSGSGSSGQS